MEYKPTKTLYILGTIVVLGILAYLAYTYDWFGMRTKTVKDGYACMTKDASGIQINGVYKNGICVPTLVGPGGPSGTTRS